VKIVIRTNGTPTPEDLKKVGEMIQEGYTSGIGQPPGVIWEIKATTPSNCKLSECKYNYIAPPENSQECVACEGNKEATWRPANREG
jgi:hypothetical protein